MPGARAPSLTKLSLESSEPSFPAGLDLGLLSQVPPENPVGAGLRRLPRPS